MKKSPTEPNVIFHRGYRITRDEPNKTTIISSFGNIIHKYTHVKESLGIEKAINKIDTLTLKRK